MKRLLSYLVELNFRLSYLRKVIWSVIVAMAAAIAVTVVFQTKNVVTRPVGWEKSYRISSYDKNARNVELASRGNFIVSTYEAVTGKGREILASVSFDGGVTFLPSVTIATANQLVEGNPHVAVSKDGIVTVMWHDYIEKESTNRIFYSTSTDMGANWSSPRRVEIGFELEMLPRIFYDDRGRLHLYFHGQSGDSINLFHAVSADGVTYETTGALIRLSTDLKGAFFPSILYAGRYVFIVWQGKGEQFTDDLYFIRSSNYGRRWSSRRKITFGAGSNESPSIILHDNNLYVTYQNNENNTWKIKLLIGEDNGGFWGNRPIDVSTTDANSFSPQIAKTERDIVISWYDLREGSERIFARKYSLTEKKLLKETRISLQNVPAKNQKIISSGKKIVVFWEQGNIIMAKASDVYVAPPRVFSRTHPRGTWSRNPVARIEWKPPEDESGIVGYAEIIDQLPYTNPPLQTVQGFVNRKVTQELDDGIYYYHIRAIDGAGNTSRTVHYKLQISANPLSIPVIVSNTHPQNESVPYDDARFKWAIDETERLKGFVYSISKDTITRPENFITDFQVEFNDLEEGGYFFNIAAVDKTNQVGRSANYYFIVGKAKQIDLDEIKRIARREEEAEKVEKIEYPLAAANFPFDPGRPFSGDSFRALLFTRNIDPDKVLGFSVAVGREVAEPENRVNVKGKILEVNDLADGEYYITVTCKYFKEVDGERQVYWTRPWRTRIQVQVPREVSPIQYYAQELVSQAAKRFGAVSLVIFGLTFSIVTVGYGRRLSFYYNLLLFRLRGGVKNAAPEEESMSG